MVVLGMVRDIHQLFGFPCSRPFAVLVDERAISIQDAIDLRIRIRRIDCHVGLCLKIAIPKVPLRTLFLLTFPPRTE